MNTLYLSLRHPLRFWQRGTHLIVLLLIACGALAPARADLLYTCPGTSGSGGDLISRGFYLPSFPGNSLDSVDLHFSSASLGNYSVTLTVRSNTYDGIVLGSSTVTFALAGVSPQKQVTRFTYPSVRINKGSRVCFAMTVDASAPGTLFYEVADAGGCPEVVQTDGTNPPLDTFRRNGVNIVIMGGDKLIVAPNESIQAAIDAASVGDTVHVDPGTYNESIRLRTGVNVVGSGYSTTTLRGVGNSNTVSAVGVTSARFEGFKVTHSGRSSSEAGVYISGGNLQLGNNWIIGNLNGVRIESGSSALVRNNIIEGNGATTNAFLDYGLLCLSSTPLIANNLIVSNSGAGLYIAWAASAGAQVINNTIVDNTDEGVWCYNGANAIIKNNILKGNSTGISASSGAAPQVSFNDVWGNHFRNYDPQSAGIVAAGPGDISQDPQFDTSARPPFSLSFGSPCINAGDPNPLYNDRDGSRNDMGAFGGPSGLVSGLGPSLTSGFLFNTIGNIPTAALTRTGASAGLANVPPAMASALQIYPYEDAPFGGSLWIHGLFGSSDSAVWYYRIYAAKWVGNTPPGDAAFQPVTDPLSKIKYTINGSGLVTSSLENIGPDASGMYLRTEDGYWAYPDLKLIWNTQQLTDGRYDLICKAYNLFRVEVPLASNSLNRITVRVDNQPVVASIDSVRNRYGVTVPECGVIPLSSPTEDLQFQITASHTNGFLRDYTLDVLYGRNRYGGVVAADHYAGVHDSAPPTWAGITGVVSNAAPAFASGALLPWTDCAYQFRLTAWARTTDGYNHLYYQQFNDHYYLHIGQFVPTTCVADLDGDGDVDGADLAIFAAQFGRTNCVVAPPHP